MNILLFPFTALKRIFAWFWKGSLLRKVIIIAILGGIVWFGRPLFAAKQSKPQYTTATAEKGTLVVSVSASGTVSSINTASINTEASGVITAVYVKDGDTVKTGDKIAEIDLDLEGKQRAAQTLASYQNAKNTLNTAEAAYFSLRSDMLTKWDTYMELAQSSSYQNDDKSPKTDQRQLPAFMTTSDDWLATEAKYKNQEGVVNQAKTSLSSAWLSYQQSSSIIYAPITGTVTGLSLQKGNVITTQRASSTNTATAQKVGSIKTDAPPFVTINLTEIDVPKVKVGQKATVTFDAIAEKTFTGTVVSVDTVGSVSSGVTTYPSVIALDTKSEDILPNMAASAGIISETKDNTVMVPSTAVISQNGQTLVRTLTNGQLTEVPVETGLSSDTQTEIVSGLAEGTQVVTAITNGTTAPATQSQSPFSPFGNRGFGGGGNVRIGR